MRKKPLVTKTGKLKAEIRDVDGASMLFLHGPWTVYTVEDGKAAIEALMQRPKRLDAVDLGGVSAIDTSGALLINSVSALAAKKPALPVQNASEEFRAILSLSQRAVRAKRPREPRPMLPIRMLNGAGKKILDELDLLVDIVSFLGLVIVRAAQSLRNPKEINPTALVSQLDHSGVMAAPLLAVLNFFIGMVIAYMVAAQLQIFGAQIFVVPLLQMGVLREMGVLSTALLVAGRSGSSYTAQIGAMVSNEEVRAMQSMGIDPVIRLVIPRIMALVIGMPFLVIVSNIAALLGGMTVLSFTMDISPTVFINTLHDSISVRNLLVGVLKAPFFAVIIAGVSCFLGFKATGSAESIGVLTTRSVVESISLVLVLDSIFAVCLNLMRI